MVELISWPLCATSGGAADKKPKPKIKIKIKSSTVGQDNEERILHNGCKGG